MERRWISNSTCIFQLFLFLPSLTKPLFNIATRCQSKSVIIQNGRWYCTAMSTNALLKIYYLMFYHSKLTLQLFPIQYKGTHHVLGVMSVSVWDDPVISVSEIIQCFICTYFQIQQKYINLRFLFSWTIYSHVYSEYSILWSPAGSCSTAFLTKSERIAKVVTDLKSQTI